MHAESHSTPSVPDRLKRRSWLAGAAIGLTVCVCSCVGLLFAINPSLTPEQQAFFQAPPTTQARAAAPTSQTTGIDDTQTVPSPTIRPTNTPIPTATHIPETPVSELDGFRSLTITPDEIPIYHSAQDVQRTGPIDTGFSEVYTWTFTTTDQPEDVWRYYVLEMRRRWGFYRSQPDRAERVLIVLSCPFYYMKMDSQTDDDITHTITLSLNSQYCE